MSSFKTPRKKFQARLQRESHFQNMLYADILQNQQTDANGELADTMQICDGGTIRSHAFLLQAASPFFQNAIASQGENYPYVREILIPDFSIKEIEKMLSLIYKGYINLSSDKEVQDLQETLQFFQVSSVDFSTEKIDKTDKITGSLKIQELNRIPQDIRSETKNGTRGSTKAKTKTVVSNTCIDNHKQNNSKSDIRRSGRAKVVQTRNGEDTPDTKCADSDYKESSENESSEEESEEDRPTKRRGRPPATKNKMQPVVQLPRIISHASKSNLATSSTSITINAKPHLNTDATARDTNTKQKGTGANKEDEGWVKPDYKNKEWFDRESRRCQTCKKTFNKPADASLCITGHKSLRCYFCFQVYSTTDVLFDHFHKRHKQAGRESTLICPYCDQAVPYKSVSCHVISVHLKSKDNDIKSGASGSSKMLKCNEVRPGPGRPPTTPSIVASPTPSSSRRRRSRSSSASTERISSSSERNPPSKKQKTVSSVKKGSVDSKAEQRIENGKSDRVLKVRDLDVTLRKVTSFGTTITFRVQKKRLDG